MTWRSQHEKVHFVLLKHLMLLRNLKHLPSRQGMCIEAKAKGTPRRPEITHVTETMPGPQYVLPFLHSTWFLQGTGQQNRDSEVWP